MPSVTAPHIEKTTATGNTAPAVACRQCRLRKVRCDSARPICKNCTRRSDTCEYDPAPKRRGPDKKPRACPNLHEKTLKNAVSPVKRARTRRQIGSSHSPERYNLQAPHRTSRSRSDEVSYSAPNGNANPPSLPSLSSSSSPFLGLAFLEDGNLDLLTPANCVPRGPSCTFYKQTWWDNLLSLYSQNRAQSGLKIYQDLDFIFNENMYWLSFVNFRRFVDNLFNPQTRPFMQPSVVLAALALSTMMKSSEVGLGEEGRGFALLLRDAAQSSLDASISASWIDPSLAQAAFLLALFEAISHPLHSPARTSSSIFLLDSIIQALSLTTLDVHDPTVTTFLLGGTPHVSPQSTHSTSPPEIEIPPKNTAAICTCGERVALAAAGMKPFSENKDYPRNSLDHVLGNINYKVSAEDRFLLEGVPKYRPDWPDLTHVAEIEKEESRRLCWSSMMLITMLREYSPLKYEISSWDFYLTKPENLAILFPGEYSCRTRAKDSIWALHCRATLVWSFVQKLTDGQGWEYERVELAKEAWKEAEIIEKGLRAHACPEGHENGRKYFLQLKRLILERFASLLPFGDWAHSNKNILGDYLAHRAGVAHYVRLVRSIIVDSGVNVSSVAISTRPLSIWWAMHQIKSGISLWRSYPHQTLALEQSLDFLPTVDFLSAVWPSDIQKQYYDQIRNELLECCMTAGVQIPAAVPIPDFPTDLGNSPLPSLWIARGASSADIPMAPLD